MAGRWVCSCWPVRLRPGIFNGGDDVRVIGEHDTDKMATFPERYNANNQMIMRELDSIRCNIEQLRIEVNILKQKIQTKNGGEME